MPMDSDKGPGWLAKPGWTEFVWIIKVLLAAALVVLLLEISGVLPGGFLLQLWSRLSSYFS